MTLDVYHGCKKQQCNDMNLFHYAAVVLWNSFPGPFRTTANVLYPIGMLQIINAQPVMTLHRRRCDVALTLYCHWIKDEILYIYHDSFTFNNIFLTIFLAVYVLVSNLTRKLCFTLVHLQGSPLRLKVLYVQEIYLTCTLRGCYRPTEDVYVWLERKKSIMTFSNLLCWNVRGSGLYKMTNSHDQLIPHV